ncbi:hypothetical protein HN011_011756 [Eciton burchellii]|nr:hypothetical protein HN011_011756 [Eciton burchellii]
MICLETQHFNINKILLLAIGLWPYQQSKLIYLQFIVFLAVLIAGIVFQLTTFLTSKCTLNFVLDILSITFFYMISIIKYCLFRVNIKDIKDLLQQLQHVCDKLKNKNEIAIIERYGYYAKCYTIMLTVPAFPIITALIVLQLQSIIFDVDASANKSQVHQLILMTEYFLDREKNFYLNLIHMNIAFSIGVTIILAIGTMQIVYLQHIYGLIKIACYRIQHAVQINTKNYTLENFCLKNNILISRRISYAVDIHRQAMKLTKFLEYIFDTTYFLLIIFGVACLSINLLRISQIDNVNNNVKEISLHLFIIAACILYMFLSNYFGQDLTNHNEDVFTTTYNIQWYKTSLYTQKLILLLLQRGNKSFTISAGGLFVGSLECFASLVKASVSYFTIIYSVR